MATTQMGQFTAIGMRTKVSDPNALIINTCSHNGLATKGDFTRWSWANPTNTAVLFTCPTDPNYTAVSVECMWQGTKIFKEGDKPNVDVMHGNWRGGKKKKPLHPPGFCWPRRGAWNGPDRPLISDPGQARVAIYIPCYKQLIEHWMEDPEIVEWVERARNHPYLVYLRDYDTGRGVFNHGPMSHAWLLCEFLNTGKWPGIE